MYERENPLRHSRDGGRVEVVGGPLRASVISINARIAGISCLKFGMTHVVPMRTLASLAVPFTLCHVSLLFENNLFSHDVCNAEKSCNYLHNCFLDDVHRLPYYPTICHLSGEEWACYV